MRSEKNVSNRAQAGARSPGDAGCAAEESTAAKKITHALGNVLPLYAFIARPLIWSE
jgi:hypothetical protein